MRPAPVLGISGNAGCGTNCMRCGSGHTPRNARHARRALPCGSLYRPHDAALGSAEMAGLRLAERLTVAAEDIRHLQRGHGRRGSGRRGSLHSQSVEGAICIADRGRCDLGIPCRGRQILMAKEHLDRADIGARFEQMGGEAVP